MHSNRKMKWYLEMKCMFWDLRKKTTHLSYSKTCFYKTPSIIHRFQQFQKSRGSSHTAVALLIEWVQPCALFKKNVRFFSLATMWKGKTNPAPFCRWFLGSVMFRPKATPPLNSLNMSVSRSCCLKHLGDDSPEQNVGVTIQESQGFWVENSFRILHDFPLQIEGIQ